MPYTTHRCPNCGADLPPPTASRRCDFCGQRLAPKDGAWFAPEPEEEALVDPERPRLWLGGARYRVLGRLARGESSDVFLGRRDTRPTEAVVIKILRAPSDADLLAREFETLRALQASTAQGAPHFSRLVPQPVAHGPARLGLRGDEGERLATIVRWRSGFHFTFDDALRAHPGGVPSEHGVWLWKRILEVLGWVHRTGRVHGAIVPRHLLIHPRDHGVAMIGWSSSVLLKAPLAATVADAQAYYPEDLWNGAPAGAAHDLAMAARSVWHVLGGKAPPEFAELLARPSDDAWALLGEVDAMARRVFGPPKYIPFTIQ